MHVALLYRLQGPLGPHVEVPGDDNPGQKQQHDGRGNRDRFGQRAGLDDPPRFADRPPDRHQEQAVVIDRIRQRPGTVLVDQIEPRGEDIARNIAFDLLNDQRADDLARVRQLLDRDLSAGAWSPGVDLLGLAKRNDG